ncbi:MAG TPA: NapC/NirT family cytochrome c [Bryobacteraceae bacterium]|nr:NapC/NirT family cytochrome c [Bryobacteraceae bacterium]
MADLRGRPVLILLTSHWISMLGAGLATLAGFTWLFVLPSSIHGHVDNPYVGILIFLIIPAVFFLGLILIPIGIAFAKRSLREDLGELPDRRQAWRRVGIFFGIMTMLNLLIGAQVSYRALDHMDTPQFCGQTCHVMKPEFTAHLSAPHRTVECAHCHVAPGAQGWVKAKMAGTRQLIEVLLNNYPRPIESAMESNRLVLSEDTCEGCHDRNQFVGPVVRVITKFNPDETNSRTETVLTMHVGGGRFGGIHGAHMGPGVHIRYAVSDKKRQTIPWVEYRSATGQVDTFLAEGSKPGVEQSLPVYEMQCVDCHNRASHPFRTADQAIDRKIMAGDIPLDLPFVKKTAIDLVKANYQTDQEAEQKIPAGVVDFYRRSYPDIAGKRDADIRKAATGILAAYQENVFPDLKVTWGTYSNNLGHMDYPGCFRCHDESHSNSAKKTLSQDCTLCHNPVAVDENAPEVLTTLGVRQMPPPQNAP